MTTIEEWASQFEAAAAEGRLVSEKDVEAEENAEGARLLDELQEFYGDRYCVRQDEIHNERNIHDAINAWQQARRKRLGLRLNRGWTERTDAD